MSAGVTHACPNKPLQKQNAMPSS